MDSGSSEYEEHIRMEKEWKKRMWGAIRRNFLEQTEEDEGIWEDENGDILEKERIWWAWAVLK